MRGSKVIMLMFALTLGLVGAAQNEARQNHNKMKDVSPEERAEKMSEKMKENLELSEEQYKKIQNLNVEHAKEMEVYHEKMKALRDEMKVKREAHTQELRNELNEEQKQKFDEHLEKMKAKKMHHNHQHENKQGHPRK